MRRVTVAAAEEGEIMRKALVLAFVIAVAPQVASAHVVRHNSIPEAYLGTWAPGEGACSADDKTAFVLSAKGYVGPAGNCSLEYVSETPSPKGSTYSARLNCPATGKGPGSLTSATSPVAALCRTYPRAI